MFNKIYKNILQICSPIFFNILLLLIVCFSIAHIGNIHGSMIIAFYLCYNCFILFVFSDEIAIFTTTVYSKYKCYGYKVSKLQNSVYLYKRYILFWYKIDEINLSQNEIFDISTIMDFVDSRVSLLDAKSEKKLKIKQTNTILAEELKTWKRK